MGSLMYGKTLSVLFIPEILEVIGETAFVARSRRRLVGLRVRILRFRSGLFRIVSKRLEMLLARITNSFVWWM
jgi:hypothetical protein